MEFVFLGLVLALGTCLTDWKRGLLIAIAVGFLQDIIRKLMPGQPIYMVLLFVPFLVAAVSIALRKDLSINPKKLLPTNDLIIAMYIYIVVVLIQILVGYLYTGSGRIVALGTIAYLFPIAGILFAVSYVRFEPHFVTLFHFYAVAAALMAIGVYLRVQGVDWVLVDSVGEGLYIYPPSGGRVELPSGFFRSPETAAWHCTTAALIITTLMVAKLWRFPAIVGILMILMLVGAMLLTGRRKMIVEFAIFGVVFMGLLVYQGRSTLKFLLLGVISVGIVVLVDSLLWAGSKEDMFVPYVARNTLLLDEIVNRLEAMLVDSFRWAHARAGWFGLGAGTASQGASHVVQISKYGGGASEGGLAKIFLELGIHGCLAVLFFVIAMTRAVLKQIKLAASDQCQKPFGILHAGFVGIVTANFSAYAIASQIYGDPLVLFFLGMFTGILLATSGYPSEHALNRQEPSRRPIVPDAVVASQ